MNVIIRPESATDRPDLMEMLKYTTTQIIITLYNNGVYLPDNSVRIWIKHFSGDKYYPKIEFDITHEELQYDITHDGKIKESHFKSFNRTSTGMRRADIGKEFAHPLLQQIDDIITEKIINADADTE